MSPTRRTFGERIHPYLAEPPGEQFVHGKYRFWLPAVLFLSLLNAALTTLKRAERKYEEAATRYNAEAKQVSTDIGFHQKPKRQNEHADIRGSVTHG